VSLWAALAGGLVGTFVLTTLLRGASELGLTRVDLPFLLGTALTSDRSKAKVIGYLAHFGFGLLFATGYYLVFLAIGESGWLLGAAFGLLHGFVAGSAWSDASANPLVESPGFLMLNYGRATPIVSLIAHVLYGAIVGGFASLGR
jgi:hypothetical protein